MTEREGVLRPGDGSTAPRGPTTQSWGGVSEALASGSSRDARRRQKPPRKPPGGSGRAGRSRAARTAQAPHPGEARRAEVALVWLEPRGEFVRRGEGVMSSRLGAGPAVSFPLRPLCFRGSAVEPAGLAFVPSSPLVLSEPLAGPTPLGQSYLCPSFSPLLRCRCLPTLESARRHIAIRFYSFHITQCLPYPLSSLFSSL